MKQPPARPPRIVHEGRGGYIEIDGRQYPIEHTEGGHFCIAFPAGYRGANRDAHRKALQQLVDEEPHKWFLEDRTRRRG